MNSRLPLHVSAPSCRPEGECFSMHYDVCCRIICHCRSRTRSRFIDIALEVSFEGTTCSFGVLSEGMRVVSDRHLFSSCTPSLCQVRFCPCRWSLAASEIGASRWLALFARQTSRHRRRAGLAALRTCGVGAFESDGGMDVVGRFGQDRPSHSLPSTSFGRNLPKQPATSWIRPSPDSVTGYLVRGRRRRTHHSSTVVAHVVRRGGIQISASALGSISLHRRGPRRLRSCHRAFGVRQLRAASGARASRWRAAESASCKRACSGGEPIARRAFESSPLADRAIFESAPQKLVSTASPLVKNALSGCLAASSERGPPPAQVHRCPFLLCRCQATWKARTVASSMLPVATWGGPLPENSSETSAPNTPPAVRVGPHENTFPDRPRARNRLRAL